MKDKFRKLYELVTSFDWEQRMLIRLVRKFVGVSDQTIKMLDIGCGYGRNLRRLSALGYAVVGVEKNEEIVSKNRIDGFSCFGTEEFRGTKESYDVLLMSHVIEHFAPDQLIQVMDGYLDRLKSGGHLFIVTPLLSRYFYDDFDHIRPYQPQGILMVFGGDQDQVQFYARNRLKLVDLWFRRGYFRLSYRRSRYVKTVAGTLVKAIEFLSALAALLTGGRLGRTDGWIGVFRKI